MSPRNCCVGGCGSRGPTASTHHQPPQHAGPGASGRRVATTGSLSHPAHSPQPLACMFTARSSRAAAALTQAAAAEQTAVLQRGTAAHTADSLSLTLTPPLRLVLCCCCCGLSTTTPHTAHHRDITERHRRLAEIIEMIHTASLVHDDVLDDCSVRRGARVFVFRFVGLFLCVLSKGEGGLGARLWFCSTAAPHTPCGGLEWRGLGRLGCMRTGSCWFLAAQHEQTSHRTASSLRDWSWSSSDLTVPLSPLNCRRQGDGQHAVWHARGSAGRGLPVCAVVVAHCQPGKHGGACSLFVWGIRRAHTPVAGARMHAALHVQSPNPARTACAGCPCLLRKCPLSLISLT